MTESRETNGPDRYHEEEREARVAYVIGRALSLSDELKTTVLELTDMLQSSIEERGSERSE